MAFDITSVFENVPELAPELKTISIDALRADEKNFYAVTEDSVAELSANIELVGLQQPLNVRPDPEKDGSYIVVSGHRRLAALRLLVDEGKVQFKDVPCMVVENGSEALNELRLIYGNANTRQLSNWELSRQAERVQELFYQLKEEGIEFPGRMRDHVAQACQVSKSKLARLKVIGERLEIFLEEWQAGKLAECVAYELAQCPAELQWRIAGAKVNPSKLEAAKLKRVREAWKGGARWNMQFICTVTGKICGHEDVALRRDLMAATYSDLCKGEGCCLKCRYGSECRQSYDRCDRLCKPAADKVSTRRSAEKAKAQAKEEKETHKRNDEFVHKIQPYIAAVEAAGADTIKFDGLSYRLSDLRLWTDKPEECSYKYPLENPSGRALAKAADMLGCSVDFLLGRTEVMAMAKADNPSVGSADSSLYAREPQWQTGEPEKKGRYWCKVDFNDGLEPWVEDILWTGEKWKGLDNTATVIGWWPLPEE